jgi:ubiquinone biosynthesis protein COQ4
VLTGYQADDPLGELCLVAFTYSQSKGLGWGFIAIMGVIRTLREPYGRAVRRAVREGYRRGRDAQWLHYEDIETLFAEPLDAARARLNIQPALVYDRIKEMSAAETSAAAVAPELREAA